MTAEPGQVPVYPITYRSHQEYDYSRVPIKMGFRIPEIIKQQGHKKRHQNDATYGYFVCGSHLLLKALDRNDLEKSIHLGQSLVKATQNTVTT